jgi:hypothetical protein
MNDLDPNFLLPLWQSLVSFFGRHPPLVLGHGAAGRSDPSPTQTKQPRGLQPSRRGRQKLVHTNY